MYKLIVVLLTDRFKLYAKVRTFFESSKYFGKKWQPRGASILQMHLIPVRMHLRM